jgi:26S proteasome regulatory subunit T3
MLVKAVANSTTANFIRVVGSEFVQKYLGEGPRMVRDVFRMARENAPAIIFIDEIDAIATKRFDAQTGADREVQRILLELLNQMDGFDQGSNVKVIMATNRADTLDPALLRPGRLDRKIEFPSLRDRRERRLIFTTIASKMSLSPEVDLDSLIVRNEPLSGAVIAAIMQEAGLRAVRKNRYNIIQTDLEDAYSSQVKSAQEADKFVPFPFLLQLDIPLTDVTCATDSISTAEEFSALHAGYWSPEFCQEGKMLPVTYNPRIFYHIESTCLNGSEYSVSVDVSATTDSPYSVG